MDQNFSISIWPEDPVPPIAEECKGCELFKQRTRIIWGEGNPQADIIVILDNPGSREDKSGNAFVCGTRQTLQHAAYTAGLNNEDLYVTYILKCRPVRRYNKEEARKVCLGYLETQLQTHNYRIAFCLGDTAVKMFFSNQDINVKTTRGVWHEVKGLLTYVSYHPLAVRRRPNLYSYFLNDWQQVARKTLEFK